MMMSILSKLFNNVPKKFVPFFLFLGKIFLSERSQVVLRWKLSHGDSTLCVKYPLRRTSVVFDLGGYKGDWSADIYKKYGCTIYIFEPVKEYVKILQTRFEKMKNIHVLPFGLAGKTKMITLHMSNNATSEYGTSGRKVKVQLMNIKNFMEKNKIRHVDLVSMNIEGGEYELLEYLLSTKQIKRFKNIQAQLHPFVPNARLRAKKIQDTLRNTHTLLYQFPFVWEAWSIKK